MQKRFKTRADMKAYAADRWQDNMYSHICFFTEDVIDYCWMKYVTRDDIGIGNKRLLKLLKRFR